LTWKHKTGQACLGRPQQKYIVNAGQKTRKKAANRVKQLYSGNPTSGEKRPDV